MPVEQVRSKRRHERILESALRVFSQKGYHDALVDDIALDSETSKGGVYFHFPNKQAIFLALLDRMATLLRSRVEATIAAEADPIAKADIALQVVLQTFASHQTLSRLFFVEALGAGHEFNCRMAELRASFAELIQEHLDEAVRQGMIPPLDTGVASTVWFGALNEVLTRWVIGDRSGRLEDAYPTLRAVLLRGIGLQVPSPRSPSIPSTPVPPTMGERGSRPELLSWHPQQARPIERERERIRSLLEGGIQRARHRGQAILASVVLRVPHSDPIAFFERGATAAADRLLWTRPQTGFVMAAVGAAWALSAEGPGRFSEAAAAWRDGCSQALIDGPTDIIGVGPVLLGGFSFDPLRPSTGLWDGYPGGRLILPHYLLTSVDGAAYLTVNALLGPKSDPNTEMENAVNECSALMQRTWQWQDAGVGGKMQHSEAAARTLHPATSRVEDVMPAGEWKALVGSTVHEIRRGNVEKVVLAREVRARGSDPFDPSAVLRRLREEYPSCFVFAVGRGSHCFVGASPERLVRLRDGIVSTMCLAGSIARGETEADDHRLGEALLSSSKDRVEHAIVVRALRAVLCETCDDVAPTSTPILMKVRNVQHLLTTVVGRVGEGRTILDLAERLHPTPAVGGYPREAALRLIREREKLDRGWYAGPLGWLDAQGEGEFAVAIRSALLNGSEASLFAGCGIVADSDPDSEYKESCLKLRPILSALGDRV